jgi:predicted DNA-binding ribbon-helix-helix protein
LASDLRGRGLEDQDLDGQDLDDRVILLAGSRAGRASAIIKRSVTIAGHSTSVSLEQPFWTGLGRIAQAERTSVAALLRRIDAERSESGNAYGNLSSSIRVFVLRWVAEKARIALRER